MFYSLYDFRMTNLISSLSAYCLPNPNSNEEPDYRSHRMDYPMGA